MLGDWMATHVPGVRYRFEELSPVLDAALGGPLRFRGTPRRRSDDQRRHRGDDARRRRTHRGRSRRARPRSPSAWIRARHSCSRFRRCSGRSPRGTSNSATTAAIRGARSAALLERAGFEVRSTAYLFPEMLVMLPVRKLRPGNRSDVDFPRLSDRMNRLGYAVSHLTARWRRVWPAGTSVVAIASKPTTRPTTQPTEPAMSESTDATRCWVVSPMLNDTESFAAAAHGDNRRLQGRRPARRSPLRRDRRLGRYRSRHPRARRLRRRGGAAAAVQSRAPTRHRLRAAPHRRRTRRRRCRRHDGLRWRRPAVRRPAAAAGTRRRHGRAGTRTADQAFGAAAIPGDVRRVPDHVPRADGHHDPVGKLRRAAR